MKKAKRYEEGGYLLDSEGNRVKSGSGDDVRTGSYDADADMESARKKLSSEVQEKLKADKAMENKSASSNDGDVDESDRRREAAASAPSRAITSQNSSAGKTKAPVSAKPSTPAVSSSYRSEGAGKAKPAAASKSTSGNYSNEGRGRPATSEKKKELGPLAAGRYSPGYAKQLDQTEQKRIARLEQERLQDAGRAAKREAGMNKFIEDMKNDPKQKELKADREKNEKMTPGQRSAARGKSIKEFFGLAKGGSVRGSGIAQRGVRKCKIV